MTLHDLVVLTWQDLAAERCSMPYRAPELFNVNSHCTIDDRIDIWVSDCVLIVHIPELENGQKMVKWIWLYSL